MSIQPRETRWLEELAFFLREQVKRLEFAFLLIMNFMKSLKLWELILSAMIKFSQTFKMASSTLIRSFALKNSFPVWRDLQESSVQKVLCPTLRVEPWSPPSKSSNKWKTQSSVSSSSVWTQSPSFNLKSEGETLRTTSWIPTLTLSWWLWFRESPRW